MSAGCALNVLFWTKTFTFIVLHTGEANNLGHEQKVPVFMTVWCLCNYSNLADESCPIPHSEQWQRLDQSTVPMLQGPCVLSQERALRIITETSFPGAGHARELLRYPWWFLQFGLLE